MKLVLACCLIWIALYGFYTVSSKKIAQTRQSAQAWLAHRPKWTRTASCISLILALYLLCLTFGSSISIVALCIFSAPLLFLFILKANR